MARVTREKFKTYQNVFDEFTQKNLFRLQSQGYFDELIGPVALGKEANIFSARRKDGKLVVIKIYRLENCDFNKMYRYLREDERYYNIRKNKRHVIFTWTQREFRNLHKAREAGMKVPTPLHFSYNILVEEYIGKKEPAPQLKDSEIESPEDFLKSITENMKRLYEGGLVHADISAFNILNYEQKPVFIDFSQSLDTKSPAAKEYLERDIKNISNFFYKLVDNEKVDSIMDSLR
ncbi:MAG: serine protein kinase RIO [Nanobdellota archaeon]